MKAGCLYAIYSGPRCCVGPGVDLMREANDFDRLSKIKWLPVAVYLNKDICLVFGGDCFRNAVCRELVWYIWRWSGVSFSFFFGLMLSVVWYGRSVDLGGFWVVAEVWVKKVKNFFGI